MTTTPTKKEVSQALQHLEDCMLEMVDASLAIDEAYLRRQRAQKALSMARDEVRAITF